MFAPETLAVLRPVSPEESFELVRLPRVLDVLLPKPERLVSLDEDDAPIRPDFTVKSDTPPIDAPTFDVENDLRLLPSALPVNAEEKVFLPSAEDETEPNAPSLEPPSEELDEVIDPPIFGTARYCALLPTGVPVNEVVNPPLLNALPVNAEEKLFFLCADAWSEEAAFVVDALVAVPVTFFAGCAVAAGSAVGFAVGAAACCTVEETVEFTAGAVVGAAVGAAACWTVEDAACWTVEDTVC